MPDHDNAAPRLVPLLQTIRGMCSDEEPHHLIDQKIAEAISLIDFGDGVAADPRVHKALAHPLRARLFAAFRRGEASPSELAGDFGEPLGNVAYHVRMLETLGCIELVRTTPRRGALEHYYRAIAGGAGA